MSSQTLTILFADLEASTRLYQTQGDIKAHSCVTDSLKCMVAIVKRNSGKPIKKVGDSILASFESTDAAYLAAIEIQQEHVKRDISVRVGFHFGEVIPDAGDVYGNTVNIGAKVASFAKANEIYTTEATVKQLSAENRASSFYLDQVYFKGVSKSMAVYRIHWANDVGETTIFKALGITKQYSIALDITVGTKSHRIDASNPIVTFGRALNNHVVVDAESASRYHAKIELVRGRYLLHDSSTNGTFLIKDGFKQEFIRRESASLDTFGSIGLGFIPNSQSHNIIKFSISTSS